MYAQVDVNTREIVATGMVMDASPDSRNIYIVLLRDDQLNKLRQLGKWTLDPNTGEITVTPVPIVDDFIDLDYGTDVLDTSATQVQQSIQLLRSYLAIPAASVTPAQREAALRMVIRTQLTLMHILMSRVRKA